MIFEPYSLQARRKKVIDEMESNTDLLARLVRAETLIQGMGEAIKEFTAATTRASQEQRQMLERLQEHNAASRREDQETHRKAIHELTEASRQGRQEDQKNFADALAKTMQKIEAITTANQDMAEKYIKREDLLWVRQGVGSVLVLIGGGLWTWFLSRYK